MTGGGESYPPQIKLIGITFPENATGPPPS
jgi:hypothetical protein